MLHGVSYAARIQDVEADIQTSRERSLRPEEFDGGVTAAAAWNQCLRERCVTQISNDQVAADDWNTAA